ncbi:A24 family peptidase [Trinickia diaoshuihuensis]|jgi:prepilin peptidase CpaA|uniref:A24 family peptidase n=1 Tax=Trinickia diaoshuihuensis TaxID=2292265 RepID=UPI000E24203A|nr:prepilin peptidase [Trinickia diaoshuihuensis]
MNTILFPTGPCVVALVVVAMSYDLHARRIPNWLVATALIAALPIEIVANGLPIGPMWWLTGALTGGLLFVPGYLIRMLGAGDVKLMAAVGALLGPRGALEAVMAATVAGGVIAFVALLQKRRLRRGVASAMSILITMSADDTPQRERARPAVESAVGSLPYGIAIAIGSVIAIAVNA